MRRKGSKRLASGAATSRLKEQVDNEGMDLQRSDDIGDGKCHSSQLQFSSTDFHRRSLTDEVEAQQDNI